VTRTLSFNKQARSEIQEAGSGASSSAASPTVFSIRFAQARSVSSRWCTRAGVRSTGRAALDQARPTSRARPRPHEPRVAIDVNRSATANRLAPAAPPLRTSDPQIPARTLEAPGDGQATGRAVPKAPASSSPGSSQDPQPPFAHNEAAAAALERRSIYSR
jgi:hypothetical protein